MSSLEQAIHEFPLSLWLSQKGIRGSREYARTNCPHCHGWKTLSIHTSTGRCHCFKCLDGGYAGDVWSGRGGLVDLVMLLEGRSRRDAIQTVFEYAGLPDLRPQGKKAERPSERTDWPPESIPLQEAPHDHISRRRLRERGLERLEGTLRICTSGTYHDRWILPIWQHGERVGWEAKGWVKMRPPSLFPDWLHTGEILYTTPQWEQGSDWAVVTESIFDAETLGQNALGIFGSKLSDGQVCRLLEMRKKGLRRLIWFFDEDAWKKQRHVILSKTRTFFENYVVLGLQLGDDPNSLGYVRCWELVARAVVVKRTVDLCQKN